MRMRRLTLLLAISAVLPPALAEDAGKQWIRVTKTDKVNFEPGGTIHIRGAHGDLNVEGWDRPEVEVAVTRATLNLYEPRHNDEALRRLDRIQVTMERKSATELTVSTAFPSRTLTRIFRGRSDVELEYRIRVPRNSSLTVHQDLGTILLADVTGDVDAHIGNGDIVVLIPTADAYSIDAKSDFGGVDSDFGGAARRLNMTGRQLAFAPPATKHRMILRSRFGNISIQAARK